MRGLAEDLAGSSDGRVCLQCRKLRVQSLGREDPLEKEIAIDSSILAWEIPWAEKPGGPQSVGSQMLKVEAIRVSGKGVTCYH